MTIQRMGKRGELFPVKLGARLVRYRMSDIQRMETEATLDRSEHHSKS